MNHTHTTNFSSESLSPSSDKAKFPSDFVWGAATSSYQIEGAVTEDGKGAHIWDIFTREEGRIFENHTGEIACDHYHRFKDDVKEVAEGYECGVTLEHFNDVKEGDVFESYIMEEYRED